MGDGGVGRGGGGGVVKCEGTVRGIGGWEGKVCVLEEPRWDREGAGWEDGRGQVPASPRNQILPPS